MTATSDAPASSRYRPIAEIGRGGMAEVYLAVAQGPGGFNKLVVLKKALRDLALQPEMMTMFVDEARLAARMNHPNVVQTYELGEEAGRHFIAMEYLDGQPYSRVLSRLRGKNPGADPMPLGHHLRVLADTLAGLHHAHELKDFDGTPLFVVHRDVSPQNVFITYDGSIKVVDFGIAKAQDSSSRTVTGEIKGKVTYMSPEQARGEPLDRRADVFAVGVMLWEAVAGRRMWKDFPDVRVLDELLKGRVPPLRELAPGVPDALASIAERALHADREARYPSALAMQRELEAYAASSGMRVDGIEVGQLVSEWFQPERQRVRAVVESQLGSLRWTGENPGWTGENSAAAGLPRIPASPTSLSTGDWPSSVDRLSEAGKVIGSSPGLPTHSGAAFPVTAASTTPRRPLLLPVVGVSLAVVLGVALAFTVLRPTDTTPGLGATGSALASGALNTATAEPGASAAPVAPESVTLTVRVSPPDAKIYLDGILLGAGSFEGKVRYGEQSRTLRVDAPGHLSKEETLTLSSDLVMSLALERLTAAAPGSPSGGPTPGLPRPKPTGRGIDDESPYGRP